MELDIKIEDTEFHFEKVRKETLACYKYYFEGKGEEEPSSEELSQNYYPIFYNIGEYLRFSGISVGKKYMSPQVLELFRSDYLFDVQVELALLAVAPLYCYKLRSKMGEENLRTISKSPGSRKEILSAGYLYLEDLDEDSFSLSDLTKQVNEIKMTIPQRFYNEFYISSASYLRMDERSLQMDERESFSSPFVINGPKKKDLTPETFEKALEKLNSLTSLVNSLLIASYSISCIVAGGAVTNCLFKQEISKNSDIDIFILGNPKLKTKKIRKLSDTLMQNGYSMYSSNNIFTFECKGKKTYQIINTVFDDPFQVIYGFDMSNVQVFYTGSNIYGSANFYKYICHLESKLCRYKILPGRIFKCLKKGFLPVSDKKVMIGDIETTMVKYMEISGQKMISVNGAKMSKFHVDKDIELERKKINKLPEKLVEQNLTNDAYSSEHTFNFYDINESSREMEKTDNILLDCVSAQCSPSHVKIVTKMFCSKKWNEELETIPIKRRNNKIYNKIKYIDPLHVYVFLLKVEIDEGITKDFGNDEYEKLSKEIDIDACSNYYGIELPDVYDEKSFKKEIRGYFIEKSTYGYLEYGKLEQVIVNDTLIFDRFKLILNGKKVNSTGEKFLINPLVHLNSKFQMASCYGFRFPQYFEKDIIKPEYI